MDWELVSTLGVLGIAVLCFLAASQTRGSGLLGLGVGLVAVGAVMWVSRTYREPLSERERPPTDYPLERPEAGYVSSDACRSCHPHEYDTWFHSYHRRMTQEVESGTMLADFRDQELTHRGKTYRLIRRGGEFWVEMEDPDWQGISEFQQPPRVQRRLVLATGSHHYQAFWYASGTSRVVSLFPMVYRIPEKLWMPLDAAFLVPPDETQLTDQARWNTGCNKCHATDVRPHVSTATEMDTQVSEFGIACESCHGPAEAHVRFYRDPRHRYRQHLESATETTIVNPADLDPVRASHVCAQCHGLNDIRDPSTARQQLLETGLTYRPGDDLEETRVIKTDLEHKFWPDGMLRVSGREFNGMMRSPCFVHQDEDKGILSCLSCHQLHQEREDPRDRSAWADDQLTTDALSNQACIACHEKFAPQDALTRHTHHGLRSSGSSCYNCHMPHTSYGLLKAIRSHEIDSPSVEVHLRSGRPNACNLCHLDQTMEWTAGHLQSWYGQPAWEDAVAAVGVGPRLQEDLESTSAAVFWLLRGDAGQRALFAWHLGWEPARTASRTEWMAPFLAHSLNDPYNSVRFLAYGSLRTLPGFGDLQYDFMGTELSRLDTAEEALRIWNGLPRVVGENLSSLLMTPTGQLKLDRIQRLLAQQDQRRVYLTE